jgi:hypothetical protein
LLADSFSARSRNSNQTEIKTIERNVIFMIFAFNLADLDLTEAKSFCIFVANQTLNLLKIEYFIAKLTYIKDEVVFAPIIKLPLLQLH